MFSKSLYLLIICCSLGGSYYLATARPLQENESDLDLIIKNGTHIAKIVASVFSSPWVLLASKLSATASSLPETLATGGSSVGSFIATPLEMGAQAASGVASGITGFLVSIPIALGTSFVAGVSEAKKLLASEMRRRHHLMKALNESAIAFAAELEKGINATEILMTKPLSVGLVNSTFDISHHVMLINSTTTLEHERSLGSQATTYILAPLAVIVGTEGAILGATGASIGDGIKVVGDELSAAGESIGSIGRGIKGISGAVFQWGTGGQIIPVIGTEDDMFDAIRLLNRLPDKLSKSVLTIYLGSDDNEFDEEDECETLCEPTDKPIDNPGVFQSPKYELLPEIPIIKTEIV